MQYIHLLAGHMGPMTNVQDDLSYITINLVRSREAMEDNQDLMQQVERL